MYYYFHVKINNTHSVMMNVNDVTTLRTEKNNKYDNMILNKCKFKISYLIAINVEIKKQWQRNRVR